MRTPSRFTQASEAKNGFSRRGVLPVPSRFLASALLFWAKRDQGIRVANLSTAPSRAMLLFKNRSEDFSSIGGDAFEVHAHMDRTSAGFAY